MSHFFIIIFPALLHLSPLEVKKVIKGLASDSSGSLLLLMPKSFFFSSPESFANTSAFSTKAPRFRGAENLSSFSQWRCASFDISAKWRMLCHSFNSSATLFLLWEAHSLLSPHSWLRTCSPLCSVPPVTAQH